MKGIMQAMYGCLFLLIGYESCWSMDEAKPVEVTLCDLYQHPDKYSGKMIRVRGGSISELHIEDTLHDSQSKPCPAFMRIIVVFPEQVLPTPGFQLVQDAAYKKLVEALHYPAPIHIDATYEGRFDAAFVWRDQKRIRVGEGNEKGYGKKHDYDGRIILRQVFEVWAEPLPRR